MLGKVTPNVDMTAQIISGLDPSASTSDKRQGPDRGSVAIRRYDEGTAGEAGAEII
jgi:hypothetical protein